MYTAPDLVVDVILEAVREVLSGSGFYGTKCDASFSRNEQEF
jgi:hypothetical protein